MEIDVREEKEGKPDVIRFRDDCTLRSADKSSFVISLNEDEQEIEIYRSEVPDLIKALKKYQELYG